MNADGERDHGAGAAAFVLGCMLSFFAVHACGSAVELVLVWLGRTASDASALPSFAARMTIVAVMQALQIALVVIVIQNAGRWSRAAVAMPLVVVVIVVAAVGVIASGASIGLGFFTTMLVSHLGNEALARWSEDSQYVAVTAHALHTLTLFGAAMYALFRWRASSHR
jgi:hypothetical protein